MRLRRYFKRMGFDLLGQTSYSALALNQVMPNAAELLGPEPTDQIHFADLGYRSVGKDASTPQVRDHRPTTGLVCVPASTLHFSSRRSTSPRSSSSPVAHFVTRQNPATPGIKASGKTLRYSRLAKTSFSSLDRSFDGWIAWLPLEEDTDRSRVGYRGVFPDASTLGVTAWRSQLGDHFARLDKIPRTPGSKASRKTLRHTESANKSGSLDKFLENLWPLRYSAPAFLACPDRPANSGGRGHNLSRVTTQAGRYRCLVQTRPRTW